MTAPLLDVVLTEALKLAVIVLTPILTGYAVLGARALLTRLHLQIGAEQQAKLETYARLAIQAAEEWAAAQIKQGVKVAAADKFDRAVETVLAQLPTAVRDDVEHAILAKLPETRAGAVNNPVTSGPFVPATAGQP